MVVATYEYQWGFFMSRKLTTEEFIERAIIQHGDKYDYSKVEYDNSYTKICIICPEHGEFWQIPKNHLGGNECPNCGRKNRAKTQSLKIEEFITKSKNKHHGYDYSKVKYVNARTKVCIICPKHGEFWQTPTNHTQGTGCHKCNIEYQQTIFSSTADDFIIKAKQKHGNIYDYSKVNYKNNHSKVLIICPEHGEFWQKPNNHTNGNGCPMCKESHGEKLIRTILENRGVGFEPQKRFDDCRDKYTLPFDFYIPEYNIAIEFDGIQHFKPIEHFGGVRAFKLTQNRDKIKTKYCIDKSINLCRIPYTDLENINEIIEKLLTEGE